MTDSSVVTATTTPPAFAGLTAAERRCLQDWRVAALSIGVDAVEDLSGRRWPCAIDSVVIGVFQAGEREASWLVVKHDDQWVVASCLDLTVSPAVDSLDAALCLLRAAGSAGDTAA